MGGDGRSQRGSRRKSPLVARFDVSGSPADLRRPTPHSNGRDSGLAEVFQNGSEPGFESGKSLFPCQPIQGRFPSAESRRFTLSKDVEAFAERLRNVLGAQPSRFLHKRTVEGE